MAFMKLLSVYPKTHLVALAALMACSGVSSTHAQMATDPPASTWSWTLFSGKCAETLQYRQDGFLLSTSGDSVTESRYTITDTPDAQGFYKSVEVATRFNAKKDCSGDVVNELGQETIKYIQFNPVRDQMIVCNSASLQACYGPLLRSP